LATVLRASKGRICKVPVPLEPTDGEYIPIGIICYAEYQGGNAHEAFTLRSRDHERQVQQSNIEYIILDIPKDAPTGLYALSHFEMRLGEGAARRTKVFSLNDVYLPDIEVEEATEPQIPWPKVGRSP
jgi:hypothetical protein